MNRTLVITIGILLVIILGVGVWFFFLRGGPGTLIDDPNNPFGGTGAGGSGSGGFVVPEVGVPVRGAGEEVAPRLWKITAAPVAHGAVAFPIQIPQVPIGTSTVTLPPLEDMEVRYIDRASGNMYRFQLSERTLERLTNLTLPGIQEAVWAADGSRAFLRFVSDEGGERIETYSLPADGSEGYLLASGLSDVVVSGTSSVLSVLPSTNGSVATRTSLLGANPVTVFSSVLSMLRVFPAGQNYAAVTKPSALLSGYAFSINRSTGEFSRVAGPASGLTLLPDPSGTRYLLSSRSNGTLQLSVVGVVGELTSLPISTIADKCVWARTSTAVYCAVPKNISGTLPDDWYQGRVATVDRIWKVDLVSRVATLEFDPSLLAEEDIDAVALTLDAGDEVLVFTNKSNGSLWLYDL